MLTVCDLNGEDVAAIFSIVEVPVVFLLGRASFIGCRNYCRTQDVSDGAVLDKALDGIVNPTESTLKSDDGFDSFGFRQRGQFFGFLNIRRERPFDEALILMSHFLYEEAHYSQALPASRDGLMSA